METTRHKYTRSLIALSIGAALLLSGNSPGAQSLFDEEGLTKEERRELEQNIENIGKAIEAISELELAVLRQQLANNDCDPLIEIDRKANQGNTLYQHFLASLYFDSVCLEQDNNRGIDWLSRAAEAGRVEAQHELAQRYYLGRGAVRDLATALRWFRRAANSGYGKSQLALGQLYESGEGVVQDFNRAREWYARSAENGELESYARIALLYTGGKLGVVDHDEGLSWALRGAKSGSERSQLAAAGIYLARKNPDVVESHKWANLASRSNEPKVADFARNLRSELETVMTRPQIVEAQKKASDWQPIKDEEQLKADANALYLDPRDYPKDEVQSIQAMLKLLGFDPGIIDGAWGTRTANAVRGFEAHTDSKMGLNFDENRLLTAINRLRSQRSRQPKPDEIDDMTPEQAKDTLRELAVPITRDAYFEAVQNDNLTIFKLFHLAGADIETRKGTNGVTALFMSIDFGSDRIFRYLSEYGANVNVVRITDGSTPLTRALSWGRVDVAEKLLDAGATAAMHALAADDILGPSPLSYSFHLKNPSLVRRLLQNGASTKERIGIWKNTPLHYAVTQTSVETIKVLFEFEADVSAVNKIGETPLKIVLGNNKGIQLDVLELLLSHGADPNGRGPSALTPLFGATMRGSADAIRLLLEFGADSNERYYFDRDEIPMGLGSDLALIDAMRNGATPLMVAARLNHISATKQLLMTGANPAVTVSGDLGSHSAVSLAKESDNVFIAEMIEASM